MLKGQSRLAALGLVSACVAAGPFGGCTSHSSEGGRDEGAATAEGASGDVASIVAAIESAKEGARAFESDAGACLEAFETCRGAEGADQAACREQLRACLPDGPAVCGKGEHGDGDDDDDDGDDDGQGGGGDGGGDDDGGEAGGDGGGDGGDGGDGDGEGQGGAAGGATCSPDGAGGEGGACGGEGVRLTSAGREGKCVPQGFGRSEAFRACHVALGACVDAAKDGRGDGGKGERADGANAGAAGETGAPPARAPSCGRTFADCVHAANEQALGDLCGKAFGQCGDACESVERACEGRESASP
jgi:hypothetical protein